MPDVLCQLSGNGIPGLWVPSVLQVRLDLLHELDDLAGGVEVAHGFGHAELQPVPHAPDSDPDRFLGYSIAEKIAKLPGWACTARLGTDTVIKGDEFRRP